MLLAKEHKIIIDNRTMNQIKKDSWLCRLFNVTEHNTYSYYDCKEGDEMHIIKNKLVKIEACSF